MKYILFLLLAFTSVYAIGQPGDRKEKIEAMRIAFITQELDLTSQEAQGFWPVYNQFSKEMESLRKARKNALVEVRDNFDSMSDADVSKTIDNELRFQQQELELRTKYVSEFKKVLPIKKVARLMRAEQRFKMKLLQEYQNRKGGHDGLRDEPAPPRD